jgi:phosphomannomutase
LPATPHQDYNSRHLNPALCVSEESDVGQLMMSVSGVRGVVGKGLTPERVVRFGSAFGTLLGGGRVVLGRDSRLSGDLFLSAAVAGLRAVGCDVVRLGIVPTPTVQLMVETLGAEGGIAVTASHNPPEWNALKFISRHGTFLAKSEADRLFAIEREGRFTFAPYDALGGESEHAGAIDLHLERVLGLSMLDREAIARAKLRVVVDALHGAAGPITTRLLSALGVEATVLYSEPTGRFPRPAEPLPENIGELGRAVRETGAHVGFALDPDGDRLAIVNEKGVPVGEDATLPLAMEVFLRHRRGPVVANYSTSLLFDAVAARHGVPAHRAPVGEANVVAMMKDVAAVIGGEGNGGVIVPEIHLGRDAPVAMALVLALLAEEKRPISAILGDLPQYTMRKDKFDLSPDRGLDNLDTVAALFPDARVDRTDGLYLRWEDGFLHVRRSGTEPIVRIIAEADRADTLGDRMGRVRDLIRAGH